MLTKAYSIVGYTFLAAGGEDYWHEAFSGTEKEIRDYVENRIREPEMLAIAKYVNNVHTYERYEGENAEVSVISVYFDGKCIDNYRYYTYNKNDKSGKWEKLNEQ